MKKSPGKTLFANTFGALGYTFCLLLWGWVGILYLPMLLENETIEKFVIPTPSEDTVTMQPVLEVSPFTTVAAAIITIAVVVATIIVIARMPKSIAKTGKTVTTKAASAALPVVARGKKLTPAKQQRLTVNLIKLAKLTFVLLPVAISFIGTVLAPPIPLDITLLVSGVLAICATLWFSAQYIAAKLLLVDVKLLV